MATSKSLTRGTKKTLLGVPAELLIKVVSHLGIGDYISLGKSHNILRDRLDEELVSREFSKV